MQQHSVLHPASPEAATVATLWHELAIVAAIVFLLVSAAAIFALLHRRATAVATTNERTARLAIGGATAVTVVILLIFVAASIRADRSTSRTDHALHIHVIGHKWWWQVQYGDSGAAPVLVTANELHVPAGTPVVLELTSDDVIHSFWAPDLAGKIDLVPGHTNWLSFRADSIGRYRGNCAEFCGAEHARMGFITVVENPGAFAAWLEHQREPATASGDSVSPRGAPLFQTAGCAQCHTVRGTAANGTVGPDLTHIGSRATLAAATFTNTPANLAEWIARAPVLKPGTQMPANPLAAPDMAALVKWLEALQ